jgi:outer membrane protein TolC
MGSSLRVLLLGVGMLAAWGSSTTSSWANTAMPERSLASKPPASPQAATPLISPPTKSLAVASLDQRFDSALLAQATLPSGQVAPLPAQDSQRLERSLQAPSSGATPVKSAPTTTPMPASSNVPEAPSQSKPVGPAKPGLAPDYLNAPANPLTFPTKAQEVKVQGVQPISLKQAIELAERNSRTLEEQKLQLASSRAALQEAQAALYPTLDLQAGITHSRSATGELAQEAQDAAPSFFQQPNQDTTSTNLNGNLTVNYDVFTSGQRPAQIRAAAKQVRAAELLVESTLEQLRLDVTVEYYDLQQADEVVRIKEAAVRNSKISLKDAEALEKAGLGTKFDVLRSQVKLANDQQSLNNALSQQQISRRRIANLINVAPTIDLAAADPVQLAGTWETSLEETIIRAFKRRSELEEQLVRREAALQLRKAAKAALGPRISLAAQYNFLDSYDDDFGIADGYSLSTNLRWSLFDGGAARARAKQQDISAKIAENRFASSRDQVRFEVEQAYSNLRSSFENIQTTTTALEQAKEALRLARLRFQAGVGTQTDVINAESDLTSSEGNRIAAILGYNRSLASVMANGRQSRSQVTLFPSSP